jgi:hypothetical protein
VEYAEVALGSLLRESRCTRGFTLHQQADMLDIEPTELAEWEEGRDIPLDFAHELLEVLRLDFFPGEVDLVHDEHNQLIYPLRVGAFPSRAVPELTPSCFIRHS